MKLGENKIDQMIREALSKEDAEMLDQVFGGPSVFEMVTDVFRGRLRWLALLAVVMGLVFMALAIYSLVHFLEAGDNVPEMLRWGALMFFSIGSVTAVKIWHWMEMQRHLVTREIKRLELQVANLAAAASAPGAEKAGS